MRGCGQSLSDRMANHKSILATIAMLADQHPKCFSTYERRRRPLKVKIHIDILGASGIEPKVLSAALSFYCLNFHYLAACSEGAARIDLNGEVCGVVTAEEAACAKERLEQQHARYRRQQEAKAKAEARARNRGRVSLNDLRNAARARPAA
jgi:ProP effector